MLSKDGTGIWAIVSGIASMSGNGESHSTTSGSGRYVAPIEGGVISGSISEGSAVNSDYSYAGGYVLSNQCRKDVFRCCAFVGRQ